MIRAIVATGRISPEWNCVETSLGQVTRAEVRLARAFGQA